MAIASSMTFRALTSSGDWTFGAGLGNYATQTNAIALLIQTSVLMWQGDCFFSLQGNGQAAWVNWLALTNTGKAAQLNSALQNLLVSCYGVMAVNSATVKVDPYSRRFSATYSVTTVYSTQIVNTVQILSGQQQLVLG